jgi:hypothetical protein
MLPYHHPTFSKFSTNAPFADTNAAFADTFRHAEHKKAARVELLHKSCFCF